VIDRYGDDPKLCGQVDAARHLKNAAPIRAARGAVSGV
jgi:hypothetical protein